MKNIVSKVCLFAISSLLLLGCDDNEVPSFDPGSGQFGSENDPNTLLTFNPVSATLPVPSNGTATYTFEVQSSTLSSDDRTYTFVVNQEETSDNLTAANYSFSELTIPANEYQGSFTIQVIDDENVNVQREDLVLSINTNGAQLDSDATFSIFEGCPPPGGDTFMTGTYVVENVDVDFVDGGNYFDVVEIIQGSNPVERSFTASLLPFFGSVGALEYKIEFICEDKITLGNVTSSFWTCGGVAWLLGRAENPGTYNQEDDSTFDLVFRENVNDVCGAERDSVLRFTKQ